MGPEADNDSGVGASLSQYRNDCKKEGKGGSQDYPAAIHPLSHVFLASKRRINAGL
jgi:hypothetical protein